MLKSLPTKTLPSSHHWRDGAGKEAVGRLIHDLSKRSKDFVVVNTSCIPDNLLEARAFPDTKKVPSPVPFNRNRAEFELANGGTIVLDEIGEMSPYLQAKLLRVVRPRKLNV